MKSCILCLSLCAGVVLLNGCATTHEVYCCSAQAKNVRGVNYALPRSIVVVEIPITRTVYLPGQYAEFAQDLLGVKAETAKSSEFKVGTPTITTRAEADPCEVFVVKIAGHLLEKRELVMELSSRGLLTSAKSEVKDSTIDFAVAVTKTTAEVVGKVVTAAGEGTLTKSTKEVDDLLVLSIIRKLDERRIVIMPEGHYAKVMKAVCAASGNTGSDAPPLSLVQKLAKDVMILGDTAVIPYDTFGALYAAVEALKDTAEALKNEAKASHGDPEALKKLAKALENKQRLLDMLAKYRKPCIKLENWLELPTPQNRVNARDEIDHVQKDIIKVLGQDDTLMSVMAAIKPQTVNPQGEKKLDYIASTDTAWLYRKLNYSQARRLAKEIVEFTGDHKTLVTGGRPTADFTPLEKALEEIRKIEGDLMAPFLGKKVEATWVARFEWVPGNLENSDVVDERVDLIMISSGQGAKLPTASPGAGAQQPVRKTAKLVNAPPAGFLVTEFTAGEREKTLRLRVTAATKDQFSGRVRANTAIDRTRPQGFYYRIPAEASTAVLEDDGKKPSDLVATRIVIAQYGALQALPQSTGSLTKSSYLLDLEEATGAMKKITVQSEALPTEAVSGVGEAVKTLQAAEAERKKASQEAEAAAAARKDEIARLQGEKAVLELEKAIQELKKPVPDTGVNP